MLDEGVLFLYEINFLLIGLLPKIFFKKGGQFNARWWLTATPLFVCPIFLLAAHFGLAIVPGLSEALAPWNRVLALAAVPFSAGSIALMAFTLGSHRIPIALWHQTRDAPASIVTWGAYRRIRHPFYASFLLVLFGAFVFVPHPVTGVCFVMSYVILNFTAAREERRLFQSQFGSEYAAYMARTGRFLPRRAR
jgi:protein-S-isoprenylcysteine O-methyltransferase Ste14